VGEEANILREAGDCLAGTEVCCLRVGIGERQEIYDYNYYSIFSIFWDYYRMFPVKR
jgi:hypothetical protein